VSQSKEGTAISQTGMIDCRLVDSHMDPNKK